MSQEPNNYQIDGNHYQTEDKYQLWDLFVDINLNFLLANAVKYIYRCKRKNGMKDIEKAKHYIHKFFNLPRKKQLLILPIEKINSKLVFQFLEKETQLSINQHNLIVCICKILYSDLTYYNLKSLQSLININLQKLNNELENEIIND